MKLFVLIIIMLLALSMPDTLLVGSRDGINLWAKNVLPALFPYILLSNYIIYSGLSQNMSVVFRPLIKKLQLPNYCTYPIMCGLLFGYPSCAVACSNLYSAKKIDKDSANYCICAFNCLSPGFIAGYYCTNLMSDSRRIVPVYICFYASIAVSAIIIRILLFNKMHINTYNLKSQAKPDCNILIKSISDATKSILNLMGFIVIFSILSEYLKKILSTKFLYYIEVTNGLQLISQNEPQALFVKGLPLIIFGGLCGIVQTIEICVSGLLDIKKYICSRIISTSIGVLITLLFAYVLRIL